MQYIQPDIDKLNQEAADASEKKDWLNIANSAANNILSAPSAAEIYLNQKRAPINVGLDKVAANVQDPWEKQKKTFEAYKQAKEGEQLEQETNPDDKSTKAFKAMLISQHKLDPSSLDGFSMRDLQGLYGDPKKIAEIQAQAQVNFQNEMTKQKAAQGFQAAENEKTRNFELDKIARQKAIDSAMGKNIPDDQKHYVDTLATKNANKIAIANQINSVLSNWDNLPDDQKVTQGRQLIKVLNSTEGSDAVGAEEAARLGGKLETAFGNFTNSNPMQFGRDLEGFKEQARLTAEGIKGAANLNQKEIDRIYGRSSSGSNQAMSTPENSQQVAKSAIQWAMANPKDPRSKKVLDKVMNKQQTEVGSR